jgi:predicted MFS family arabinose efflux permease
MSETDGAARSSAYSYYVLAVLVAMNAFNFVDRQIVSVLLQQIKEEFAVSDELLGLLTGAAFVLVHAVVGIPIARWADRGSRRNIIAIGVLVWSALTALSGAARSFGQLLVLRVGVGIGEAAGTPPAHSLISDYFPPERRARALSIFAMGLYAGIMFGYLLAGWVGELFGWRMTFVVVGLPGLLIAALVYFTVREPPRETVAAAQPLREVIAYLISKPAYYFLLAAASLHAAAGYSMAQWAPTFLVRVHDFSYGEVGTALGLLTGIFGAAGALTGGALADRLGKRDVRAYAWVAAAAAFLALPFGAWFLLADSATWALAAFAPHIFASGLYTGPLYAMNQSLAKPRMRATAVAIQLFMASIIGGGVGPWAVGRMSDQFRPQMGDDGIRWAILIVLACGTLLAGGFYLVTARTLQADVEAATE